MTSNQWSIPVITQKLTHVPFPAECWLNIFSLFVSLSLGPIWHHWEAYTVWPGAGGEVCEVCEGEDRDWAKLCQTTEVGLTFFSLFSCVAACVSVCVCLCLHGSMLKGCLWNVCGVLWPLLGQNLTCFWNTGLILQLQCARSPSFSLHPWCSQLSPSLQAHIWCSAELCWRGEEVGADWRVIDRMWSEGE